MKLGYNELGYNELGFNKLGYNELGYNELGYNELGYNVLLVYKLTRTNMAGPKIYVIIEFYFKLITCLNIKFCLKI